MRIAVYLSLLVAGCEPGPAFIISSAYSRSVTEVQQLAPDAADVSLECDGKPCPMVPIARQVKTECSEPVFWTGTLAEAAIGGGFGALGVAHKNTSGGTFNGVAGVMFVLTIFDLYSRVQGAYCFHGEPEAWRVHGTVVASLGKCRYTLGPDFPGSVKGTVPAAFPIQSTVPRLAGAPALPDRAKLAVLEFKTFSYHVPPELVQRLTDRVVAAGGGAIKKVLGVPNYCRGACEVDAGRCLGLDAIVSGVVDHGKTYTVSLQLYETKSGALLSTRVVKGETVEELNASLDAAAKELLADLH